jgi:hypothetical protein
MFHLLGGHHVEFPRGIYLTLLVMVFILMGVCYLSIYCWQVPKVVHFLAERKPFLRPPNESCLSHKNAHVKPKIGQVYSPAATLQQPSNNLEYCKKGAKGVPDMWTSVSPYLLDQGRAAYAGPTARAAGDGCGQGGGGTRGAGQDVPA